MLHTWKLRLRKVRSLAQDSAPPPTGLSFPKPLALHPGTWCLDLSCWSQPWAPFPWKLSLLPGSSAPQGLPPHPQQGAVNSDWTYLRRGPSVQALLGLTHFSLSPRPTRWTSPIFHASHLGPYGALRCHLSSLICVRPFVTILAPEPQWLQGDQLQGKLASASVTGRADRGRWLPGGTLLREVQVQVRSLTEPS